jgi:hypothetical protein
MKIDGFFVGGGGGAGWRVCILCGEKMWRCVFYGPLCVEGSWRVDLGMSPFIDDKYSVD